MPSKSPRAMLLAALPRLMHVYWRFTRGLTMGVRAVVIDDNGRVFLVKHSYADGWHLPGGGVEPGEALLEALKRELMEEGNIELLAPPTLHGVYFHPRYSKRDHIAIFIVRSHRQLSAPVPNHEIIGHGYFAPDALPPDATAGTRARIVEVFSGTPAAQRW
jgi:8-oxo-dGTP pyrophosphatase MutT (NUDIX family)